jgi:hypothetical protein
VERAVANRLARDAVPGDEVEDQRRRLAQLVDQPLAERRGQDRADLVGHHQRPALTSPTLRPEPPIPT